MTFEFTTLTSQTVNNSSLSYGVGGLLTRDLNGDGNLDLVATYSGPPSLDFLVPTDKGVAVFYGTGGGQFTAGQRWFTSWIPNSLAVGDIDRDGRLDLITISTIFLAEGFSAPRPKTVISVLKGTDSGFSAEINSSVTPFGSSSTLAVADFNGDGNLDVAAVAVGSSVIPSATTKRVSILFGDGTGQFSNEKTISLGFDTSAVVAADFNGDGLPDLAIGGDAGGTDYIQETVSVLLSTGAGDFSSPNNILVEGGSTKSSSFPLVTADFNSDGKIDLGNGTWYLAGDGTGQFAKSYEFTYGSGGTITGDFNSDGKLDVTDGGSIFLGNGTGRYSFPEPLPPGVNGAVSGDFDRDGKPDLAQISQNGTITVFLNRTIRSDLLVVKEPIIDASIESGGLILDFKKGTLQIGGINQPLTGSYSMVRGSEQADRIAGSRLKEFFDGLAGNDILVGEDGDDTLVGGLGNDRLTGGKGKDKFVFNNGEAIFIPESLPFNRAMGIDRITDFENGKDKIELYRNTFTAFTGGRRFSFASVDTKKAAQKSKAFITYVPKTGSLFYNQNGARSGFGTGGQFADLTNELNLRGKDFEVV